MREGITAVVSVKLENAQFESQTKDKLNNSFVRTFVSKCVSDRFGTYIEEHPQEARELVLRCITAQKARDAARSARELTRRKGVLETSALPASSPTVPTAAPSCAKFISSRAIRQAVPQNRAETGASRPSCPSAVKFSTSRRCGSTACSKTRRSRR